MTSSVIVGLKITTAGEPGLVLRHTLPAGSTADPSMHAEA
jgi:hypothetical protein